MLLAACNAPKQTNQTNSTIQPAAADSENASALQSSSGAAEIALPALLTPSGNYENGITRLADVHTIIPSRPRVDVTTYIVQPGDNLFLIAERYGLDPETVLWGNYEVLQDNPQFLKPDQELRILPTNGVYYQWAAGDNIETIANFFKVEPEAILEYPGNRLLTDLTVSSPGEIEEGTWVIIPGGKRELKDWGPPVITRKNPAAAAYYGAGYCGQVYEGSIGTGYFIWPTVATFLSGYDYSPSLHPGIDIAGGIGNAIYAADGGVVVYAGWSEYGYGYLIVLDHGTGWQSAYAHLSSVGVSCGQSVAQGTVIGGLGSTGNSTGAHLHFELRSELYGKVNPWDFVSP
jgi:murein DD-endopeptidase MepM/ murein hydrolase activator NlpD